MMTSRDLRQADAVVSRFTTTMSDLSRWGGYDFKPTSILAAAEWAVACYEPPEIFHHAAITAGAAGSTRLTERSDDWTHRAHVQVSVAWTRDIIVVACQGSKEPEDWRDDLRSAFRTGWPGVLPEDCGVGRGFLHQAKLIGPVVARCVRRLRKSFPEAWVICVGHSLGAPIAALLPPFLRYQGIVGHKACVLFESPRPGNAAFASWWGERYGRRSWSIVNVHEGRPDIVTRLPRSGWPWHARHLIPDRRAIHDAGRILFGESTWQTYRAANPVTRRVAGWRLITRMFHHVSAAVRAHSGELLVDDLRALVFAEKRELIQ